MKASEQEILAKIRTLLALERNYLAEERTALAEFRTGLALAFIGPPASATVAYIFSLFHIERPILLDLFIFTSFILLTIIGVWTSFRSRSRLNKIRRQKRILRDRQADIIRSSKTVFDLLGSFED